MATSLLETYGELRDVPDATRMLETLVAGRARAGAGAEGRAGARATPSTPGPVAVAAAGEGRREGYGDLNRASEQELVAAKRDMEKGFERHRILPGESGYQHDTRQEFAPDEESSWDG